MTVVLLDFYFRRWQISCGSVQLELLQAKGGGEWHFLMLYKINAFEVYGSYYHNLKGHYSYITFTNILLPTDSLFLDILLVKRKLKLVWPYVAM